jgi:bifunctional non-homologous end joining protein LigD
MLEPVHPRLTSEMPIGRHWRYELKFDGFRATLYVIGGTAFFRSKTKRHMRRFDGLARLVAGELGATNAILDGEIVVLGERGPEFNALMFHRSDELQFAAFDLLWLRDADLRAMPYERRKARLRRLTRGRRFAGYVEHYADPALLDLVLANDLEGVVAKRAGESYGSNASWLKIRNRDYTQKRDRWKFFVKGK